MAAVADCNTAPKKYVLLVDGRACFSEGQRALDGLDCELDTVEDLAAALRAAAELEKLSVVVVNSDSHRYGRARFASSLKGIHPRLPLLWIGSAKPELGTRLCGTWSSDVEGLKRTVAELLKEEFYASGMTYDILDVAHGVFRDFGLEVECSRPYIKSSLSGLNDLNALIAFSGERLSGHVLLSSAVTSARTIHENALPGEPDPGADELEDLLGEVANRVVGGIKRVFESRSRSFRLKTTAFLRGSRARYRHQATVPSLALEFSDRTGVLSVEFCPEYIAAGPFGPSSETAFLDPGQIHFL